MSKEKHIFWDNQPVRMASEYSNLNNQFYDDHNHEYVDKLNIDSKLSEIIKNWKPKDQKKLPKNFGWEILDLNNDNRISDLIYFLNKNYMGINGLYSLELNKEYLKQFLSKNSICIALVLKKTNKIYGFISGILDKFHIYSKDIDVAIVSFLTVHKKLRGKYIAAALIRRLINKVAELDIWQAIYMVKKDIKIHKPLTKFRTYHRPLNYKQMAKLNFIDKKLHNHRDLLMIKHKIKYKLVDTETLNLDERKNISDFYNNNMKKKSDAFLLHSISNNVVIKEFVTYNESGKITSLISFFIHDYKFNNFNESVKVGILYKYCCTEEIEIYRLLREVLYYCKKNGFSLFNVNDSFEGDKLMEYNSFLEGTGINNFYMFNWDCNKLDKKRILFESI